MNSCINKLKKVNHEHVKISDKAMLKLSNKGFREDLLKTKLLETDKILNEVCQPDRGTHKFTYSHSKKRVLIIVVAFRGVCVHIATAFYNPVKIQDKINKQSSFFITKRF